MPADTTVYSALDEHQKALSLDNEEKRIAGYPDLDWWLRELQRWKGIFTVEFKLRLPPVAFCVKPTTSNCFGYFRPGHNEFGLQREVAINRTYIGSREPWMVLGTLLHELLHAWQDKNGTPGKRNYHNAEFRDTAGEYGLIVDRMGVTQYAPNSPFMEVLKRYGVAVPADHGLPIFVRRVPGGSKMKKWSCGCTNVRVAVANFRARCLNCNQLFIPQ